MRLRLTALLVAGCLSLVACSGADEDDDEPTLQELADIAFAGQAALDRVEVDEPMPNSPSSVSLEVVMDADASAEDASAAASIARAFSEKHVASRRWTSHVYVGEPPARIQVEVYPKVVTSAQDDVRAAYDLATSSEVTRVAIAGGTPNVTAPEVKTMIALVPALRRHRLWSTGGSVQAENGRLRIMDAPARVTEAQLIAIIEAARRYPAADFALEATATGERYPELFINRLTAEEAAAVTSAFTESELGSDNAEGYELDFTIRAFGADGNPVDSGGTFGRR